MLVDKMASEISPDDVDFGKLAEVHRGLLQRVAYRLSGNPEIAKDLVQEALLRGLRHFDPSQPITHAGTWLVAILTHVYFDYLKHEKVVRKAEPQLAVSEAFEYDETLIEIDDDDLYAAIQALEPDLRELVELCYLKQMRYRDVAALLGIPMGTIGTRLMRARAHLRALLTTTSLEAVNQ